MKKFELEVPENIRFISDWENFPINLLRGHSIINKTITGCGFTHYCLTNYPYPTILCAPRKFLLENKHEQLGNTHLVINKGEKSLDIDNDPKSDIMSYECKSNDDILENFEEISSLKDDLNSYLLECHLTSRVPKILVTYDSLKHVLSALGESKQLYSIIVDEFQNIFMDSRFKAAVELNFLEYLQSCPNVTYLSATPYIEEYLDELDEFKDLPYYELKWDPNKLRKIDITHRKTKNILRELEKIIVSYKNGNFPQKVLSTGEIFESKELVIYVNSVKMICSIVKRLGLSSEEVNIICSNDTTNQLKLKKIGHSIGKAPLKGEPHKMFTLCTRTTYVGADFYSTSALSIIVSDCAIDSLSLDIRMDFPQIMGRQRLKENVFRDECIFIYKLSDEDITLDDFEKMSNEKIKFTNRCMETYNTIKLSQSLTEDEVKISQAEYVQLLRRKIKADKYTKDYLGISDLSGQPVFNKLVYVSERRAFELRSNIYKTEFSVYNEFHELNNSEVVEEISKELEIKIDNLRLLFINSSVFYDKMKALCELLFEYSGRLSLENLHFIPMDYRCYINYLGIDRIRANGYKELDIKNEMNSLLSTSDVRSKFIETFIIGSKYSLKESKLMISEIYQELNIIKTPKATDLEDYFNVRKCIMIIDGKRINGYELLSLKE